MVEQVLRGWNKQRKGGISIERVEGMHKAVIEGTEDVDDGQGGVRTHIGRSKRPNKTNT